MKPTNLFFISLALTAMISCGNPYLEMVNEQQRQADVTKDRFVPESFKNLLIKYREQDPFNDYTFQFVNAEGFLSAIDLYDDTEECKVVYYADLTPTESLEIFQSRGYPSNISVSKAEIVGLIVRNAWRFTQNQEFDVKVYRNVDEPGQPWEGYDNLLQNIADAVKLPYGTENFHLPETFRLEAVVTPKGSLVYCNLLNPVENPEQPEIADQINRQVFLAFRDRSNHRGWKPGKLQGKRVYSKIRMEIPTAELLSRN
jgi:hypothetical protein